MPVYEYECCACGKVIETWQSLSDAPMTDCPHCAGSLKKLISMSSFRLKGGGWYADGYASTNTSSCSSSASCAEKSGTETGKTAESTACSAEKKASCGCG